MPEKEHKRRRGRPRGSSKVMKKPAPPSTRRSTRSTTAARSQEVIEVQAAKPGADQRGHESPTSDASSAADGSWDVDRQILQDENEELRHRIEELTNKNSELENSLSQTLEESATEVHKAADVIDASERQIGELEEAIKAKEAEIKELGKKRSEMYQRARKAEEKEALLQEQIQILTCGQPTCSAGGPSAVRAQASSSSNDPFASSEDDSGAPGPSRQPSGASRPEPTMKITKSRNSWSKRDEELLISDIGKYGTRWFKTEKRWPELFPDQPRNQEQLKDKAGEIKANRLKFDKPLPLGFDQVAIKKVHRDAIIAMNRNPYRREEDMHNGHPIFIYLDE